LEWKGGLRPGRRRQEWGGGSVLKGREKGIAIGGEVGDSRGHVRRKAGKERI
jgi:hypothetical protein